MSLCGCMVTKLLSQSRQNLKTVLFILFLLGISLLYLRRAGEPFDFRCYYQGSKDFYKGESLYFTNDINRTCERAQKAPEAANYKFHTGFYYPPSFGGMMIPFGMIEYALSVKLWNFFNIWLFFASLYLLIKIFAPYTLEKNKQTILILVTGALVLSYVQICIRYGQVQILVVFLLILSFYLLERDSYFFGSLCIVASICIKFIPAILLLYPLLIFNKRNIYRFFFHSGFLVVITLLFSCFFRSPLLDLKEFAMALGGKSQGIAVENLNQSFFAGMIRLLTEVKVDNEIKPFINIMSLRVENVKFIYIFVSSVVFFGLIALGFFNVRNTDLIESRFSFYSLLITFVTIFSPLAWSHYFVWLLPGIFLIVQRLIKRSWKDEKFLLSIFIFLALSNVFTSRDLIGDKWNPLFKSYSHIMWSGITVFTGLCFLIWQNKVKSL